MCLDGGVPRVGWFKFQELDVEPRTTPSTPEWEGIHTIMQDWNFGTVYTNEIQWDSVIVLQLDTIWEVDSSYQTTLESDAFSRFDFLVIEMTSSTLQEHSRRSCRRRIPLFLTGHKLKYAESSLEWPNWYKLILYEVTRENVSDPMKQLWPDLESSDVSHLGQLNRNQSQSWYLQVLGWTGLQLLFGSDWYRSLLWKNCIFMNHFGYQVSTVP